LKRGLSRCGDKDDDVVDVDVVEESFEASF